MRARGWLASLALAPTISCGPIPDEVATTTIGVLPLAWLIAWFIGGAVSNSEPLDESEDRLEDIDDAPATARAPWLLRGLSFVVLAVLAVLAGSSSDFEEGAVVGAVLIVCPAVLGYALLFGQMFLSSGSPRPGDWAAIFACGLLLVPFAVVWAAEGDLEDGMLHLGLLVLLPGTLLVFPGMVLYLIGASIRRRARLRQEFEDHDWD